MCVRVAALRNCEKYAWKGLLFFKRVIVYRLSLFFSLDRLRLRNKCAPAADSFHPPFPPLPPLVAFLQACFSSAIFLRRTSRKRASSCLLLFTYRVFFRECVLRGAFQKKKVTDKNL